LASESTTIECPCEATCDPFLYQNIFENFPDIEASVADPYWRYACGYW